VPEHTVFANECQPKRVEGSLIGAEQREESVSRVELLTVLGSLIEKLGFDRNKHIQKKSLTI
jgi:hypothetical protein